MTNDPLGYFLTWTTYGTWLPGDSRGWVEYRNGFKLPNPIRELEAAAKMSDDACRLSLKQRAAVECQIAETCQHRNWKLHAVNCRTNHVHVVLTAFETHSKKIRIDLKAWATRRLKQFEDRENWWTERGSIRWLFEDKDVESATVYTLDGQEGPKRF